MGRLVGNVDTVVDDLPRLGPWLAEDRHQQRGFTRAVGADQADGFAFVNVQRDFFQGLDRAVKHVQVLHFEDRPVHTSSSSSAPR